MPEGHTIHRLAAALGELYGGQNLHVSSPQGRFAEGAGRLDGQVLLGSQAHGKHLFLRGPSTATASSSRPTPSARPADAWVNVASTPSREEGAQP